MIKPFRLLSVLCLWFAVLFPIPTCVAATIPNTDKIVVSSVIVDNKIVPQRANGNVYLNPSPKNITFSFGLTNSFMRLRCRLEGFEDKWHEGGGFMFLAIRFYNKAGDPIDQKNYQVAGESAGWNGSLKSSQLTHRRETLIVPPNATQAWVVISSAGPPATEGIYVVANLMVTEISNSTQSVLLIQSPLDQQPGNKSSQKIPHDVLGWTRDGTHLSMANIIQIGQEPPINAFAIQDDDVGAHAEWRTIRQYAPVVTPGSRLVIEWNEMYSIGIGDMHWVLYPQIPSGNYRFHIVGASPMGELNGFETSMKVIVAQPLWKRTWFWTTILVLFTAAVMGSGRYLIWRRMKREMVHLKNQQALESERLRIAHDIHDDLGAQVTQISMATAMSLLDPALSDKTRAELDQIRQMSRDLVSALYQTVWVVNPEYDNLDALGNHLCQLANQLCKQTNFRCRLVVSDLPRHIQISSSVRHNLSMIVKESIHNAIKHARGSEIVMTINFNNNLVAILIEDNGCGFHVTHERVGNGLINMQQRMKDVGGKFSIERRPERGTIVKLTLLIKSPDVAWAMANKSRSGQ